MQANETTRLLLGLAMAALLLAGCASPPAPDAGAAGADASGDGAAGDASDGGSSGSGAADGDGQATEQATLSTGSSGSSGGKRRVTINQAGSSTVYPIAEAWAEEFGRAIGANIVVGGGGSGAGLAKFCRGELDIADASRPIRATETDACEAKGIEPFEVQVAIDGLSVVVPISNDWVDCLTVAELNRLWTAQGGKQADSWADLRPAWSAHDEAIELFGPGTDSGTYDYWKEAIIHPFDGTSATTRSDYTPSEDDNVLVRGVAGSDDALGFFGLAYAKENADTLKVLKVDGGDGCVEPTDANVASGLYAPLSRPLFMYTDGAPTGVLLDYFQHGLGPDGQALAAEVGYIPLPADTLDAMMAKLDAAAPAA